jgi:acyl dehydratase
VRYFEDLHPGDTFTSPSRVVTQDEIVAFARQFDPQPFHLDPKAAEASFFGRLVASGWHTAALTMRNFVDSGIDLAGGIIGAGMEALRWPSPLYPDEEITTRIEILDARTSQSRPQLGLVRFNVQTQRTDGAIVHEMIGTLLVPRRPGG